MVRCEFMHTVEANFVYCFSANVWCCVINGQHIGSFIFERRLTSAVCAGFLNMSCRDYWKTNLWERGKECASSMTERPHISVDTRLYMNQHFPGRWGCAGLATLITRLESPWLPCVLVQEESYLWTQGRHTWGIISSNWDAARRINDQDTLRRVAHSVVKRARMYIEAEGGHLNIYSSSESQPFSKPRVCKIMYNQPWSVISYCNKRVLNVFIAFQSSLLSPTHSSVTTENQCLYNIIFIYDQTCIKNHLWKGKRWNKDIGSVSG
jgi:hypothetical protein